MEQPSRDELIMALDSAEAAHKEYEAKALQGELDEQWPGWYAAYVLGRLGDFVTPSTLAGWLSAAPVSKEWSSNAADYIRGRLGAA